METVTPYMRWVKTQTDVLLPLLRHIRAELGEEQGNALVYPVLREYMKKWVAGYASNESDDPVENFYETSDRLDKTFEGDVDYDLLRQDDKTYDLNVTRCRYAQFFRQLGEPELGAILVCEVDDHIAELSAPEVTLTRATTMMQGGSHCPFRYRIDKPSG